MSKQLLTDVPAKKPLPLEKPKKTSLPKEPSKSLLPDFPQKPKPGKIILHD